MATPPREELVRLRKAGLTRDEIAVYYGGVSVSRVKRWIKELGIETAVEPRRSHANARSREEKRRALALDDGMTLIEKAKLVLGKRLGEDYRGYLLDGRLIRVDALLKAAGLEIEDGG